MKELINIGFSSNVTQTKQTKETKTSTNSEDTSFKDFFSFMFSNTKNETKTNKTTQILPDSLINITKNETSNTLKSEGEKKSLDEHLLEEILEVISLLKNDIPTTNFPKYSPKVESFLSDETALKELKNVKNITDLMQLSKKYDLGLEKISIQKVKYETIKEEFPNLEKKGFFDISKQDKEKIQNTFLDTTKKPEIKTSEIPFNAIQKPTKKADKEQSIFEKIITKEKPSQKNDIQKNDIQKNTSLTQDTDQSKKVKSKSEENISLKHTDATLTKQNNDGKIQSENIKEVPKEMTSSIQKEKKEEKNSKTQIKEDLSKGIKEAKEFKEVKEIKENLSKETLKSTRIDEVKAEGDSQKRGFNETVLKEIKNDKEIKRKTTAQNAQSLVQSDKPLENSTKEISNENENKIQHHSSLKDETKIIKQDSTQKQTPSQTKETFNSFSNDLKEKLEQYKPPIMKVQMALNPKSLGEVDVTIINRGSNLHVNITSNTNTMTLFVQNQAEFKNSLVNMGFTNLEMNFSDQRQGNQDQTKNGSSSNKSFNEEIDDFSEEANALELIVPQYI
jgi:flagellar hook-length control protein FliK